MERTMFMKLNRKGDTIVEVLIGVALLGAVMAAGYSISTRSLNGIRIAQERSEATKIAEGQIELIKKTVGDSSDPVNDPAVKALTTLTSPELGYCFSDTAVRTPITNAQNNLTAYPTSCIKGTSGLYHVFIKPTSATIATGITQQTFTVNMTWERSGGGTIETLKLVYRDAL